MTIASTWIHESYFLLHDTPAGSGVSRLILKFLFIPLLKQPESECGVWEPDIRTHYQQNKFFPLYIGKKANGQLSCQSRGQRI